MTAKTRKGEVVVDKDETPFTLDIAKIPTLKPAFKKDGTVTAASSSRISDGAAAVVLARESFAAAQGLKPLARILGYASFAREPEWFTLAPVGAIQKLLTQLNWQAKDVDLYEINEAFAVVTMAAMKDLGLDHAKVNVNGGACALGHPIGATGARIMTTLLYALQAPRQEARHREPVHRRRRSDGDRHRTCSSMRNAQRDSMGVGVPALTMPNPLAILVGGVRGLSTWWSPLSKATAMRKSPHRPVRLVDVSLGIAVCDLLRRPFSVTVPIDFRCQFDERKPT